MVQTDIILQYKKKQYKQTYCTVMKLLQNAEKWCRHSNTVNKIGINRLRTLS